MNTRGRGHGISEEQIRQLLAAGDHRAAAEEAIRALGPDVLKYLRALLRDEDDAADAFSQFAENLWKGLASLRSSASLRTWALRLAVNIVADFRKEAWRRRVRRLQTEEISAIADHVRVSSAWHVERRLQALEKLRLALSLEDRTLLVLRIDQRLSWKEIADVLSSNGQTASIDALCKRFERLKERIGRMARERGLLA